MKKFMLVLLLMTSLIFLSGCDIIFPPDPEPTPTPTPPTPVTTWDAQYNVILTPTGGGTASVGTMKFEFVLHSIFGTFLNSNSLGINIETPNNNFSVSSSYSSISGYSFTANRTVGGVEERLVLNNFQFNTNNNTLSGQVSYTNSGITRTFNCTGTKI